MDNGRLTAEDERAMKGMASVLYAGEISIPGRDKSQT